jgi:type I restriction enzyme M protein
MTQEDIVQTTLKDSNYHLSLFSEEEISALRKKIVIKEAKGKKTPFVTCIIRDKDIQLKPEEIVRQLFTARLVQLYGYPKKRIAFEYAVTFGREKKSADVVVFDKDRPDTPYIIVELKKPKLKDGKDQLRCHHKDPNYFEDITDIPKASQRLKDILSERYTLKDLIIKDKIANERKSLTNIILEMEDEVLANAGVDVFEEVFKLIFTKLYDEFLSQKDKGVINYFTKRVTKTAVGVPATEYGGKLIYFDGPDYDALKAAVSGIDDEGFRVLEFRNSGQTDTELKNKIQDLFNKARNQWTGVFPDSTVFDLSDSHLAVCVSSLQDVKTNMPQ